MAFFRAGADVATTASYQASFTGFAAHGIGRDETTGLLRRSVALACSARSAFCDGRQPDGRRRWVAASVGPYGAALADGSEYRGRYGLTVGELAGWHRPRLEVLASAGADVLALETIPDADEAEALVGALDGLATPAWLSYSIAGARTRAGQPLTEAFAVVADAPQVVAVGVNCCDPGGRRPGDRRGPGGHREARVRLPEQRRGLGRRGATLDGAVAVLGGGRGAVGGARGGGGGRVLPGGPGGDRGGGAGAACRRGAAGGAAGVLRGPNCPHDQPS